MWFTINNERAQSPARRNPLHVAAFPGGKVAVYTGMLRFATTDNEQAGEISHSLARSLTRHGAERMSRSILIQVWEVGRRGIRCWKG